MPRTVVTLSRAARIATKVQNARVKERAPTQRYPWVPVRGESRGGAEKHARSISDGNRTHARKELFSAGRIRACECDMTTTGETRNQTAVYWHRVLPPLDAEPIGAHTLEAASSRVPGTLSRRDDLWDRCYQELMANTDARLAQEIARLAGNYAHVYDESIEPRRDQATGEAWLHGRFSYMLYRQPSHESP
jgi:hypothetical protein